MSESKQEQPKTPEVPEKNVQEQKKEQAKPKEQPKAQEKPKEQEKPKVSEQPKAAEQPKPQEQPKAKEAPAPQEEQTNCPMCNKHLERISRYYRNGKFYCSKKCWKKTEQKLKQDKAEKEVKEKKGTRSAG